MHAVSLPSTICFIAIFILVVVFSAIFVKIPDYKSTPTFSNDISVQKRSTYNREFSLYTKNKSYALVRDHERLFSH